MNQTKKRLAIIKLAISMTDTDTIQLQVLKLGLLKTDSKMKEILALLNEAHYVQAQKLISEYIESPSQTTVVQRTSQADDFFNPTPKEPTQPNIYDSMIEKKEEIHTSDVTPKKPLTLQEKIQQAKDQSIIDEFQLFTESETEEEQNEIDNYDDFLDTAPKAQKMSTESINYDDLLNVNAKDVLPGNISLNIEEEKKDTFFSEKTTKPKRLEKDDFFDIQEPIPTVKEIIPEQTVIEEPNIQSEQETKDLSQKDTTTYSKIPYIDQKFKNMQNQYPPQHESTEEFTSVDAWLIKISNEGYTESDIETMMKNIEETSTSNKAEAAQLLLITAATESKYARFRLARALYKGEILQKNLPESFTLINRLAMNDNYPEAICDLGQFYENGIGTTKDKTRALELYKEAMELGIHRAMDHHERIAKNKKLFSLFGR